MTTGLVGLYQSPRFVVNSGACQFSSRLNSLETFFMNRLLDFAGMSLTTRLYVFCFLFGSIRLAEA